MMPSSRSSRSLQLGGDRRVAPPGSLECQLPQLGEGGAGIGDAGRHDALADRDPVAHRSAISRRRADCLGAVGKVARQLIGRAEPGSVGPDLLGRQGGQRGVQRDGAEQAMAAPILRVRGDHAVGGDGGQSEPAGGGQCLVAPPAGPELGVEVLRDH